MRDATEFYVIFDGPPGPEAGRFIEVETSSGESVRVGEWTRRSDGLWALGPFVETSHCSALARECERLRNELVDALRLLQWLHYAGYDADAPGRYANDRALRLSGAIHAAQVALGEASPPALGEGDAMSRVIQPCLDCPGVRYEGEPCRCCEGASEALERVAALEAALREAVGYLTAEADIHAGAEEGYHDFLGRARALVERALEVTP